MSARELRRAVVLGRVKAGSLSLTSAAVLMAVSYRQAKRLWRRYREGGAKALQHRAVGRPSNRGTAARVRQRALTLIQEKYSVTEHGLVKVTITDLESGYERAFHMGA